MRHLCALVLTLALNVAAQDVQGFIQIPSATIESHPPQTEEQLARASAVGRYPGQIEFLQPSLDRDLQMYTPVSGLEGNYTLASSDVLAALTSQWIQAFMTLYPNVTIKIPGPYAGSLGAVELIQGNLQGVFVSRELKPSDITSFSEKFGYAPFSVPVAGGSYRQFGFLDTMVFAVNKDNPIETLSFDQLDSILSTTRARGGEAITTWGQVGATGAWANKSIEIYGLQPWNGIEEFIRQRVLSFNNTRGEWRNGNSSDPASDPHVHWDKTIFNATRHVYDDPYGLTYTGLAYIDRPVKVLATYNNTGDAPVAPTYDNIAAATWPLTRVIYFNTNKDPSQPQDPVLKELTKFVLSQQGQQILLNQGIFLPFRASQQAASLGMVG